MTAKKAGTQRAGKGATIIFQAGAQSGSLSDALAGTPADEEKSQLEEMFGVLGSIDGGLVLVHRAPEQTDRDLSDIYVGKIPFSSFGGTIDGLLDLLRDAHGGGKFNLRFGNNLGHWKGKRFTVRVEKINMPAAPAAVAPAAAVPAAPKLTDNPHFGKAVELGITGVFALLTAMATRGGGGNGLTVADLVALQGMNKQPDVLDTATKLAAIKDLFSSGDGGSAPAAAGDGAGWMGMVKSVITALPQLMAQQGGAPAAQQAAIPHNPGASGPDEPGSSPAQGQPLAPAAGGPAVDQQVEQRVLIGMLVNAAKNDSNAAAYAIMVDDVMGSDVVDQLLATPAPVQVIMGMFPLLAPYEAWVTQLVDALRELTAPQDQAPAATEKA